MGLHGGLHGHFHFLFSYLVEGCEDMLVIVRADDLAGVAGTDFLAADDDRDVQDGVPLALEFGIEGDALGRTFEIGFHRLVGRNGEVENRVVHDYEIISLIVGFGYKYKYFKQEKKQFIGSFARRSGRRDG